MKAYKNISDPSPNVVREYLTKWDGDDEYKKPELALQKLFNKTYPENTDITEVLAKTYVLDNAYSTGILSNHFVSLAKHIVDKNIDSDIENGRLEVVGRIRNASGINNYYSFATKYCSFHNPDVFPIYDSRVVRMLIYFMEKSNFAQFTRNDLNDYQKFCNVILKFKEHYRLDSLSFREIDKYLWLMEKDVVL